MKTLKERLKGILGGSQKNIDVTAADGKILTVITEGSEPKVGDAVEISGSPAPDGEYKINDGSTWKIVGGKIESITPAEEGGSGTPETGSESTETVAPTKEEYQALLKRVEAIEKKQKETDVIIKEMDDALIDFAKAVKSTYVPKAPKPETRQTETTEIGKNEQGRKRTPIKVQKTEQK